MRWQVVLLHLPLKLTRVVYPGLLPLQFSVATPLWNTPTNLLFFHFLLPLTLPKLNLRYLTLLSAQDLQ